MRAGVRAGRGRGVPGWGSCALWVYNTLDPSESPANFLRPKLASAHRVQLHTQRFSASLLTPSSDPTTYYSQPPHTPLLACASSRAI